MNRVLVVTATAACVLMLAGCAAKQEQPPPAVTQTTSVTQSPTGGGAAESTVTATAIVQSVDVKNRLVTLKGPDGTDFTVHVDERVKNLPQLKKGDEVTATYYESIAYEVLKPGEAKPGVAVAGDVVTAQPGQKPGAAGARSVTITATIAAIDKKNQHVTLRGPKGESTVVKVRDPSRLDTVKVGDLVQITYTEALAIAVESARK